MVLKCRLIALRTLFMHHYALLLEHIIVDFIGWYMITLGKGTAQARQYLKNTALIPN